MSTNPVSSNPGETTDDIDQGASTVGKAKRQGKKRVPPKAKTIAVRATREWAEWVEEFADQRRTDVAKLIDTALAEHAEKWKFRVPPKRIQ
jgi:hypothetical protein